MIGTSVDKLFCKLVVCVRELGLFIRNAFFVVRYYALYFVQRKFILGRDVSQSISVMADHSIPFLPPRAVDYGFFRQRAEYRSDARIAFEDVVTKSSSWTD